MTSTLVATEKGVRIPGETEPVALTDRNVGVLADADGGWLAVVDHREVVRGEPGSSWETLATTEDDVTCLLPIGDEVLLGTERATLLRWSAGRLELVEGFDHVAGRDEWHTPWGGPPAVRSLARGADGALFANVHVGGIVRSVDDGATWKPTIDIDFDVHQVLAHHDPGFLLAPGGAGGLAVSVDGGDTWRFDEQGLHATYCRAVAVTGRILLVSASQGPSGRRAAIYRRPLDASGPFRKCETGLPEWFDGNIDTHCLDANDDRAVFATADGHLYESGDEGSSWHLVEAGLPKVHAVAIG